MTCAAFAVNLLAMSTILGGMLHAVDATSTGLGPKGDENYCFTFCTTLHPTDPTQDQPAGCQRSAPEGLAARSTPLWVYKGGWDSIDITGSMTKILLRDLLGYKNITLKYGAWKHNLEPLRSMGGTTSTTGTAANVCKDSDGLGTCFLHVGGEEGLIGPDVFMEHWPDGWDQVESTMIYNEKTVINLGPVGYFGQNGVYATGTTDSTMREFWKTWKTQSNVNLLPSMADTQAYLDSSNVSASTDLDKHFICDSAQYPWCTAGRYTPPQCVGNSNCRDLMLFKPSWAACQFEQLVTRLGLMLNIIWLGPKWKATLSTLATASTIGLFYDFKPTTTTAQLPILRVTFPQHDAAQYTSSVPNRYNNNGSIDTDLPAQSLGKIVSKRFQTVAPDGFEVLSKISLKDTYIEEMLKLLPAVSAGIATTDALTEAAACNWLKNNSAIWSSWLPAVWNCPAGTIYDMASNACKACEGDTIAALSASRSCEACPSGKTANRAKTQCQTPSASEDMMPVILALVGGFVVILCGVFIGAFCYSRHKAAAKDRAQAQLKAKRKAAMGAQGAGEDPDVPKGVCTIVDTDVESSTALWDWNAKVMSEALLMHDKVLRDGLQKYGGIELLTEGDAFLVCFAKPEDGVKWMLEVQEELMNVKWPAGLATSGNESSATVHDPAGGPMFCGLRVRMGADCGELGVEKASQITSSPVMQNARKVSDFANGGQVLVSNHLFAVAEAYLGKVDAVPVGNVSAIEAEPSDADSGLAAVSVLPVSVKSRLPEFVPMYAGREEDMTLRPPCGEITIAFTHSSAFKHVCTSGIISESTAAECSELLDGAIRDATNEAEGYVCKGAGGKFMCVFGNARAGLQFGFSVQQKLSQVPWPQELVSAPMHGSMPVAGTPVVKGVRLSVGMATGEPSFYNFNRTTQVMDYFGPVVNMSARVSGEAGPGQVACHTMTKDSTKADGGPALDFASLGFRALKGIKEEQEIFCAANADTAPRRQYYESMATEYAEICGTATGVSALSPGLMSPVEK